MRPEDGDAALELIPRPRRTIAPGVVHVPGWLNLPAQRMLVAAARDWARQGPGARRATLPGGARMSVETVCLGWHWIPYRYSRTRDDQDGSPVQPFPDWLAAIGADAVADAYDDPAAGAAYHPDVALVNSYRGDARLGMHQDREELAPDPVVSLSLGTACVFRIGSPQHRRGPWHDVELCSGDLLVFGGEHRLAYHGVPKLLPGRDVPPIGTESGERLNLTLRVSGLHDGGPR
ncbi:alpha-ketoglutarate-dependent dioxygenase AlkB family protein [Actinomycetospora succinea]|uniref:alpha-ketoglutarate-dependent dioxygenase AlkB family protein n=1 Tax=Actinomycetospora succinea TaxID=663603 RepID=UPI001FB5C0AD|nr:alpha-ketoglutarate-dependent dioxygenase AlkB [Actinomycetospora succinea]